MICYTSFRQNWNFSKKARNKNRWIRKRSRWKPLFASWTEEIYCHR